MIDRIHAAETLATKAHAGQVDKSGADYILHPRRVAAALLQAGAPEDAIVAGLLHDTVEDTQVTLALIEFGFGQGVAAIVDAVTRREGETYVEFIERAARHPLGRLVKRADIEDNLRPGCPASLRKRYERALETLTTIEETQS